MKNAFLRVTYSHGRPLAAYYSLPREPGDVSARCRKAEAGLVIDFTESGRPIGIEITEPRELTLLGFNHVLLELGFPAVEREELAPLDAA